MWERYDGNTVQALAEEIEDTDKSPRVTSDYSRNHELLALARDGDGESEVAMRAIGELCELNYGLVKKIALRFRERGVELEDLIQIGTIGMIKAIRTFDSERGTCFSTYAVPLIFGEIRRHIRDEGPIKVGRGVRKLGAELSGHRNRIIAEEGREPHIFELAKLCGVDPGEAAMALDALLPLASLSDSAFGDEDGIELGDTLADTESIAENERFIDKIALAEAIGGMPVTWQKIVTLRYYRGLTQQAVATSLGLTQVKVSREEKKILEYLRQELS